MKCPHRGCLAELDSRCQFAGLGYAMQNVGRLPGARLFCFDDSIHDDGPEYCSHYHTGEPVDWAGQSGVFFR